MTAKIGAPRLGFGCAAVPGPLTAREALTLLETAYACGIRHFDTARMYGHGESEAVLGELVRQRPDALTLVTKAGIEPATRLMRGLNKFAGAFQFSPTASRPGRFEAAQLERSVETSLRKLKTDHIDVLLLHEIRAHEVHGGLEGVLQSMRQSGKIGAFGIATSVEDSEAIIAAHPALCGIVQVPAQWLDRPRQLPPGARLMIHSVLGARLAAVVQRLRSSDQAARRFREETGLGPADSGQIGRLMLQAAMLRNPEGVTLFSSTRVERVRRNADLLTARPDTRAVHALERAMRAPETSRREVAP